MTFASFCRLGLLLLPLAVTACVSSKSAVDRHATHLAYQIAKADFDPNFRTQITNTIRSSAKFLQPFNLEGEKDRAAGLTPAQARTKIASLKDPTVFPSSGQKYTFINRKYSADNAEKLRLLSLDAATETYMDGFNGIR